MPAANRVRRSRSAASARVARRRRPSSGNGWMWWLGGIVVSVLITVGLKLANKVGDDSEVRQQMLAVVQTFPDYSEHTTYYTKLIDLYHRDAFEAAYSMGGRRRSASLDVRAYLVDLASRMASAATADGQTTVATTLQDFKSRILSR